MHNVYRLHFSYLVVCTQKAYNVHVHCYKFLQEQHLLPQRPPWWCKIFSGKKLLHVCPVYTCTMYMYKGQKRIPKPQFCNDTVDHTPCRQKSLFSGGNSAVFLPELHGTWISSLFFQAATALSIPRSSQVWYSWAAEGEVCLNLKPHGSSRALPVTGIHLEVLYLHVHGDPYAASSEDKCIMAACSCVQFGHMFCYCSLWPEL